MKKEKKADEKNSLEQLLLRWKRYYDENSTKCLQFALLFVLVVVIVLLFRSGAFKGANRDALADSTYFAATQNSFTGAGVPDADVFAATASAYKNTTTGAVLHVDAAEAFVRRGLNDVARKQRYSAGTKLEEGEKLSDPIESYNAAVEQFELAASTNDSDVKARAYYGEGVAYESIASVSANDEAVVAALESAKACYEKATSVAPGSPYATVAAEALLNVSKDEMVAFYKSSAHAFVTLPDPAETPSITSGDDSLEAGAPVNVDEEFKLGDDDETASPEEENAGSDEAPSVEE